MTRTMLPLGFALLLFAAAPRLTAQAATAPSVLPPAPASSTLWYAAPATPTAATDGAIGVGPRVRQVGVSRAARAAAVPQLLSQNPTRRDVAWMVLGGAALVVGSIVGGDGGTIIMVTGGVIGLVGLWRYLQYS